MVTAASNYMGKDVCYRSLGGLNPMWFRALWERVFLMEYIE
jgi:hypothetical protein